MVIKMEAMKHGSLFSGIGGFDLAAEWMGWENVFHCEYNPFGRRVLEHYWPNAISYEDITQTDFTSHANKIDILTGGFPCQPYSASGKRLGKEDERHLWPEMLRAIREISPRYVVGENVRGLLNWNDGLVFNEVQSDLEAEGYDVLPFLLPAAGINAPHERYRIWFIAYAGKIKQNAAFARCGTAFNGRRFEEIRCEDWNKFELVAGAGYTGIGFNNGQGYQPAVVSHTNGLPKELDGIAVSEWIDETLAAYGNAIVPQLAYQIFKAIEETESIITTK